MPLDLSDVLIGGMGFLPLGAGGSRVSVEANLPEAAGDGEEIWFLGMYLGWGRKELLEPRGLYCGADMAFAVA